MRRGADDQLWKTVRQRVRDRDSNTDRLLRIITVREAVLLSRTAPKIQLITLDPAHIYPASGYPGLIYEENNIVLLNRYSHENLDNSRHPIMGTPISKEEMMSWWERIAGIIQWGLLQKKVLFLSDAQYNIPTEPSSL